MRSERCACRGWVDVEDEHDDAQVVAAVAAHNVTQPHAEWRSARQDPMPLPKPVAVRDIRRCPGIDEPCGLPLRPHEAMCYGCARHVAVGRRAS